MKKEKKAPVLRFPWFEGEWEGKELGAVSSFLKGKGISKSDIEENGKLECIRYGELYTHYNEVIFDIKSKTNLEDKNLVLSKYNDVIIPASGETPLEISKASCVLKSGVALSGDLNIIRTNLDGVFLSYYLNNRLKNDIASLSQWNSVVHLYSSQLKKLKLKIPQNYEQQKIAEFLSRIDTRIEQLTKKKELLESYKKWVMQKIFSQGIRFKDEEWGLYPDWNVKKIKDIFEITRGNVLAMTELEQKINNTYVYPVYSSQTKNNGVSWYYHEYLFEDCITWTTDGANAGDVKYRSGKFYCTNVCGVLKNKKWFANVCVSEILNSVSRKYVSYVGNPKLMNNVMGGIEINLPSSIDEQKKISNYLTEIDKKIELVIKKINWTKNFKQWLLQQMFV